MASKNPSFKIILGSSSKARKQILAEMGYEFTIMVSYNYALCQTMLINLYCMIKILKLFTLVYIIIRLQILMRKVLGGKSLKIW